jgi:geranylgeranyl diphosphate synthase type II
MTTESMPFAEYVRARRALVDEHLERWLPAPPACPAVIGGAMRYSLLGGGKRFRPILTLAAAEEIAAHEWLRRPSDQGLTLDDAVRFAMPAACAIEMIHTYSLVHDDLPAMDNDSLRRGRPTSHVVHGEGMAILAGDGLLSEAFSLLARVPEGDGPAVLERRMRTIAVIAEAAGPVGMVGGQAIDLEAARPGQGVGPSTFDLESLRRMHSCKTGALIRASAVAGAIMAGALPRAVDAVSDYAVQLGLAFQIVDDILDVEGDTSELGKTAGKDAAAGKPTYPALVGLDRSRELAREAHDAAVAALAQVGIGTGRLHDIASWVVSRTN